MFRNPATAITFVTIYLLFFLIGLHFNISLQLLLIMFSLSPFMILWMVYTVLKNGKFSGREFEPKEEWGYEDKKKSELGVFY